MYKKTAKDLLEEEMMQKILESQSKKNFVEDYNKAATSEEKFRRQKNRHEPELVDAARYCIRRRLSYSEAVEELKNIGFDVSEKTYQRIKSDIGDDNVRKLQQIHKRSPIIKESMLNTQDIMKPMWDILHSSDNNWEKMSAAAMILKCGIMMAKYYRFPEKW